MSLTLKKWQKIDKLIGPVYRLFHSIMRRLTIVKHPGHYDVVIIKLFGLGSIVHLLDMCEEWNTDLSKVTLITSSQHAELCRLWGLKAIYIEPTSVLNLATGCFRAVRQVRRLRPNMIVDLERCSNLVGIFRTIMAWSANCKTFSVEQRALISDESVVYPVSAFSQRILFREAIKLMPSKEAIRSTYPVGIEEGKIIVNINASDLLESRRYGLDSFASAIRLIHEKDASASFYLSGVSGERSYVQGLVDKLPGVPIYNAAGEWSLERLVRELSTCELLITGDSAPLHLGRYLKVPTLSIWGPTQPGHFGFEPSAEFRIISLAMACSPCFLHPQSKAEVACKGAITCMRQLKPEAIAGAAIDLMSRTASTRIVNLPVKFSMPASQPVNALG